MEAVNEDLHYWKYRALNVETTLKELMEKLAQSQEENRILKKKLTFHMKKKFELEQVPIGLAEKVFKKMSITSLSRMRRTTKTMSDNIQLSRSNYIKTIPNILPSITPSSTRFLPSDVLFKTYVQGHQYYRFSSLEINDFEQNETELRRVLSIFKDVYVFVNTVSISNSPIIPEIFDYFKPIHLSFIEKNVPLKKNILGTIRRTETFTDALLTAVGKSAFFELKAAWNGEVQFEIIRKCMEILGKGEHKQKIKLTVPFMTTCLPSPGSGFDVCRGETVDRNGNYYCFVVHQAPQGIVVTQIGGKVYDMNSITILCCENWQVFEDQLIKETTMTDEEKKSLTYFMQKYFPKNK